MLIIFKELTKNFEKSLLKSLTKNDKKEEFENLRKNLIIEVSGINPKEISKYLIKGIDLISTSSSITKSNWIDLSMRYIN